MVDADDRDILEMQGSKITPNANLTMYQKTSAVYGDAANNAKVRAVNAEAPRHYICGIFGFGSKPVTGRKFYWVMSKSGSTERRHVDGFAELLGIPSDGRASGFRALQQTLSSSERSETALTVTVYF